MDWKAHLLFGILLGAAVAIYIFHFPAADTLRFCIIAGVAALLPDLDIRSSKASQITYVLAGAALLAGAIYFAGGAASKTAEYLVALIVAFFALDFFVRPMHRGFMHGFLFLFASSAIAYFALGGFVASAFLIGYFSHLLADGTFKLA
ncbi:MAG: metal-dependent hydrolase [Candidatus Micrarchaeota archaeon]|nr:metal-dependent hydrolase [Candidatus Micrarchaeota archaeon]